MQKYSKNCYNMAKYCHNRNSVDTDIQKTYLVLSITYIQYCAPSLNTSTDASTSELNLCTLLADCATALFSTIKVSVYINLSLSMYL